VGEEVNYYAARQRAHDKKWDWTCMNDGKIWRSGPCADHEDGHPTREEAEKHFYDDSISKLREITCPDREMRMCDAPGCDTVTQKGLVGTRYFSEPMWLCKLHRSKEVVPAIRPFRPGIEICSS
jgi:hypothetical protein